MGPGDSDLITIKSLKRLQAATVVAFPAGLKGKPGVAERIISPWLTNKQIRLPLTFPYVLDERELSDAWQQAAKAVWPYLQKGDVVFACEGDVSFYGTFAYLAQHLQRLHPEVNVEAIAGVSSPMAAAAALGIPLTCQAEKLAILPALYSFESSFEASSEACSEETKKKGAGSQNQLEDALRWAEVVVLMKVGSVYTQVWKILERQQLLASSYVVVNATRPEQQIFTHLQNHPNLQLPYFSLLIVRAAARKIV